MKMKLHAGGIEKTGDDKKYLPENSKLAGFSFWTRNHYFKCAIEDFYLHYVEINPQQLIIYYKPTNKAWEIS